MSQNDSTPQEAVRRLRLRIDEPGHADPLPGVEGLIELCPCGGDRIQVTYDVRLTDLDRLVEALRDNAVPVAGDRRTRLKIAWRSYLDRNARANLIHPGSPCCSNPTTVYASRKRR